jgi:hypothetical protein
MIQLEHRNPHTLFTAFFVFGFALVFTTTCFFGSGSESLLSDSDEEEESDESDESEESETEYCQSMIAPKYKSYQHIPSVLALLFLTLLGLEAFVCLFIAGILLSCGW